MNEKKKTDDMTAEEALEVFKKGKKIRIAPPRKKDRMSIYNLRIENETLDGLMELACREDEPPSAIAREILGEGVRKRLSEYAHGDSLTWNEGFIITLSNLLYGQSRLDPAITHNWKVSFQQINPWFMSAAPSKATPEGS